MCGSLALKASRKQPTPSREFSEQPVPDASLHKGDQKPDRTHALILTSKFPNPFYCKVKSENLDAVDKSTFPV